MNYLLLMLIGLLAILGMDISLKRQSEHINDFQLNSKGILVSVVSLIVFTLGVVMCNDKTVVLGLTGLAIISIPMIVSDFQSYHLPNIMSLLFEIVMLILVPFLFGATSWMHYLQMIICYAIALVVLTVISLLTNTGFADAYVGAWLAIPLFVSNIPLLPVLISICVATLLNIGLTYLTKSEVKNIPYVPGLIWAIPLIYVFI